MIKLLYKWKKKNIIIGILSILGVIIFYILSYGMLPLLEKNSTSQYYGYAIFAPVESLRLHSLLIYRLTEALYEKMGGIKVASERYNSETSIRRSVRFRKDGSIMSDFKFKGNRTLSYREYYKSGKVQTEEDDIRGIQNTYYESGELAIEGKLIKQNNSVDIQITYYNKDGSIRYRCDTVNGITNGTVITYDSKRKGMMKKSYKNNELIEDQLLSGKEAEEASDLIFTHN